jgi:drug/metabolite transporter (DMT)-like permease
MFFSTVLPYMFYTKGLNALGDGGKASILASVEPIAASILGIIAFGEPMTLGVILGLACILISVYILR